MKTLTLQLVLVLFCLNCTSQDWITYIGPDNSFSVKFPVYPKEHKMDGNFGIDSSFIVSCLDKEDSISFALTIHHYSEERIKPDFNEEQKYLVLDNMASILIGLIGQTKKKEWLEWNGYPGFYAVGEILQGAAEMHHPIIVKSCLVGRTMYVLGVTCSVKNKDNPLIDFFFDSFSIQSNNQE